MIQEKFITGKPGLPMLLLSLLLMAASIICFALGIYFELLIIPILCVFVFILSFILMFGLKILRANAAKVFTLFGDYYGTLKGPGYFWINPFVTSYNPAAGTTFQSRDTNPSSKNSNEENVEVISKTISMKLMTLDNNLQKVNDLLGNPVEIRIAVIWRVLDTAKAVFNVDNYLEFLALQTDSALRDVVRCYPYDVAPNVDTDGDGEPDEGSLRGSSKLVAQRIQELIQERVDIAGIEVVDARITHLSYASEIASIMLQRQQAGAIVDARRTIVDGAVGMTKMALQDLEDQKLVNFSGDQRAQLISNLLVVVCGNRDVQPVGTTNRFED